MRELAQADELCGADGQPAVRSRDDPGDVGRRGRRPRADQHRGAPREVPGGRARPARDGDDLGRGRPVHATREVRGASSRPSAARRHGHTSTPCPRSTAAATTTPATSTSERVILQDRARRAAPSLAHDSCSREGRGLGRSGRGVRASRMASLPWIGAVVEAEDGTQSLRRHRRKRIVGRAEMLSGTRERAPNDGAREERHGRRGRTRRVPVGGRRSGAAVLERPLRVELRGFRHARDGLQDGAAERNGRRRGDGGRRPAIPTTTSQPTTSTPRSRRCASSTARRKTSCPFRRTAGSRPARTARATHSTSGSRTCAAGRR